MKLNSFFTAALCHTVFLLGCAPTSPPNQPQPKPGIARPGLVIYKTTKNYEKMVPVVLSEEKTILSYPDSADLFHAGHPRYPIPLKEGFLIDNIGIEPRTAFLKVTYEEFSKNRASPVTEDILDDQPFIEIHVCSIRRTTENLIDSLNQRIEGGDLASICRRIH